MKYIDQFKEEYERILSWYVGHVCRTAFHWDNVTVSSAPEFSSTVTLPLYGGIFD
ncbi:MAG TPA: hypothetical protein VHO49_05945 [Anaerolineales bacterium]|nr:hypothetical protein [Anaerolineales bacterium]